MQKIFFCSILISIPSLIYCAESPIIQRIHDFVKQQDLATLPPSASPEINLKEDGLVDLQKIAKEINRQKNNLHLSDDFLKKAQLLPAIEQREINLRCAIYITERLPLNRPPQDKNGMNIHVVDFRGHNRISSIARPKICVTTQLITALKSPNDEKATIILNDFLNDIGYNVTQEKLGYEIPPLAYMKAFIKTLDNQCKERNNQLIQHANELYSITFRAAFQDVNTKNKDQWNWLDQKLGLIITACTQKYPQETQVSADKIARAALGLFDEITY